MRRTGLTLALLLCAAVPATAAGAPDRAGQKTLCTAFGRAWVHHYNAEPGPIRIVTACCALRSPRTLNSACKVMVTVRRGPGEGTYGCSIATVTPTYDILANKPQACRRLGGVAALPA